MNYLDFLSCSYCFDLHAIEVVVAVRAHGYSFFNVVGFQNGSSIFTLFTVKNLSFSFE